MGMVVRFRPVPWLILSLVGAANCGGVADRSGAESPAGNPLAADMGAGEGGASGSAGSGQVAAVPPGGGQTAAGSGGRVQAAEPARTASGCKLQNTSVMADVTSTDQCKTTALCDNAVELVTFCDGENDGTNTSLCDCYVNGNYYDHVGLVDGEGARACETAYSRCLKLFAER
jgi:hypothetical protein